MCAETLIHCLPFGNKSNTRTILSLSHTYANIPIKRHFKTVNVDFFYTNIFKINLNFLHLTILPQIQTVIRPA